MTPEETTHIAPLLATTRTLCLGRYLVEMPTRFVRNSETRAKVDDVSIEVTPQTRLAFDAELTARRLELEAIHMADEPTWPLLRRTYEVPLRDAGLIFDRAEHPHKGRFGRMLELLAWRNGFKLKMMLRADDNTFPEDANEPMARQLGSNFHPQLEALRKLYTKTRGMAEGEIPTEPGLCIANGFVQGRTYQAEVVELVYQLDGAPDVFFGFSEDSNLKEKDTLLQRSAKVEAAMKLADTTTLRKGVRKTEHMEFEEWLMHGPLADEVFKGTRFQLTANEATGGRDKPYTDLTFHNGARVPQPEMNWQQKEALGLDKKLTHATLTPAEAMAIWDQVTSTLRPRPGAF
ncbi:T6SS immunity protein Tli4 family protein [Roseateles koreensis]|uniref:T6SS immunity protein Tli4 family protein n=1 Tax=Roseateles koreensis TaxID=2987526 RepID=A0ABT5KSC6_9BURK|nr:T6SS immunity protein Tli4 family protein [Roseateles koreensis]MDC8785320.1 T6SS immunity protein Tli4 family protein [Roseateles koreensis]